MNKMDVLLWFPYAYKCNNHNKKWNIKVSRDKSCQNSLSHSPSIPSGSRQNSLPGIGRIAHWAATLQRFKALSPLMGRKQMQGLPVLAWGQLEEAVPGLRWVWAWGGERLESGGQFVPGTHCSLEQGSGKHVLVLNGFLIENQASLSWNLYSFQLFFPENQFYSKFLGKIKTVYKVCISFFPVTRRSYWGSWFVG